MGMLRWMMVIKRIGKIETKEITARAGVVIIKKENQRSDNDIVMVCIEKDRGICSNGNTENESERATKTISIGR